MLDALHCGSANFDSCELLVVPVEVVSSSFAKRDAISRPGAHTSKSEKKPLYFHIESGYNSLRKQPRQGDMEDLFCFEMHVQARCTLDKSNGPFFPFKRTVFNGDPRSLRQHRVARMRSIPH